MFRVLVTAADWAAEAQRIVRDAGGEVLFMRSAATEDELVARLAAASPVHAIVLRGSPPVTARVMAASPALKVIAKNGAGVDGVDLDEAQRRGIAVKVAAGANAQAVAEHALAMMLALARGFPMLDWRVRRGEWASTAHRGGDFRDAVVGIVGFGAIGRTTARLASAVGAQVVVWRRERKAHGFDVEHDLDRLLARVDILSLHCQLTDQTRGLIGRRELARMKRGALLVNTARGAIVDEAALVEALGTGQLGGAGLDTFASEPLPLAHPLLAFPQVILTPHVAGATAQAALRTATVTARNVVGAIFPVRAF
jgi:D-3-phosphoglycerate dehydrogenase